MTDPVRSKVRLQDVSDECLPEVFNDFFTRFDDHKFSSYMSDLKSFLTFGKTAVIDQKDIDKLERIQRRANKMIPELRDLSYESRLLQCGLTTLDTRGLRGDQIEVFKTVSGYEDVDRNIFFKLKEGSTIRGNKAVLVKEQCRLDMRKYSFSQRVIHELNKLLNDCVNASSVNMFKNKFYRYIRAGYT